MTSKMVITRKIYRSHNSWDAERREAAKENESRGTAMMKHRQQAVLYLLVIGTQIYCIRAIPFSK
jgi:hypothetical protein